MRFSKDILALNPELRGETRRKATAVHADRADWLLDHLRVLAPDVPTPIRDYPFLTFKIDLAWPAQMLATEVNGGLMREGGGKHATSRDHQKIRQMVLAGWRVLIFTSSEVRNDPLMCITDIRAALGLTHQAEALAAIGAIAPQNAS